MKTRTKTHIRNYDNVLIFRSRNLDQIDLDQKIDLYKSTKIVENIRSITRDWTRLAGVFCGLMNSKVIT